MTIKMPQVAQPVAPQNAAGQTWRTNLARLEGLAEILTDHGLRTRLMTPPGRVPSLHVVNPAAAALAEDVYAGRGQDGLCGSGGPGPSASRPARISKARRR